MSAPPSQAPRVRGGLPPTLESWLPREHTLYRPRHGKRQVPALVCALAFFLTPVLLLGLGVRPDAFENRALKEFPSLSDGWGFFTGLNGWASDNVPLRQFAVHKADGISTRVFGDPAGAALGTQQGTPGIPTGGGVRAPVNYPLAFTGKDDWLYYGQDVQARCDPVTDIATVIDGLNRLRRAVESSGRKFVLVVAPDKYTMEPQHLPDHYVGKDCAPAREAEFWQRVPAATGMIDLRPALTAAMHTGTDPIYDQHDTHWTYGGGMTMANAIAQAITPGVTRTWRVSPLGIRSWTGDLEKMLGRAVDRRLPSYRMSPDGGPTDRARYIASDFKVPLRLTQTSTPPPAGLVQPKTAVIADSFTQFAAPYLAAGFRDVTVVHTDSLAGSEPEQLAALFADTDVITFEFVERNVVGGHSTMLRDQAFDRFARALAQRPR